MKNIFILILLLSLISCNTTNVVKGNGEYFYNEHITLNGELYFIQHSTLSCPAIKGGVRLNHYFYGDFEGYNLYCSKCMDNNLIYKFDKKVRQDILQ